ncbi:FHA domain-containing protein [Ruegeria sp. R13_0]|uniref:FHA domain-containing protein n=1 Tax=Ruegeria sp. R13_0 TaxID=2821099 RepID=UPI001AD99A0F|nr:FHA domain-containing protein [Ruegeria sp. R13_0]MBO9434808.1 FHA domain-containing protein [Ruegeria sp. R13_0]
MFKYKSPLSRLLEGAGKAKEEETTEAAAPAEEKPEPIADFNALRAALGGGNLASEAYEETYDEEDELTVEGEMPEFSDAEDVAEDTEEETSIFVEEAPVTEEVAEEVAIDEPEADEQIVTLHLSEDERVEAPVQDEVEVAEPEVIEPVAVEPTPEPTPAPVEPVVEVQEPVAEAAEPQPEPEVQAAVVEPTPTPAPIPAPAEDRRSRVKTTFLGFERADTHVQDLIETAEPVAKTEAAQETFPVGWLVVTQGPGRGSSITLTEGLMQIGRNDDQAIQLDFGDTGISRSNHAVIAYDPEDRKCYLGHGGKANLVRLNGKPVLSTVALSNGDLIRISETSIRFMAFCDEGFDWRDS